MSGRLSNVDNSHPFYGSSDQGMVTGCAGGAIMPKWFLRWYCASPWYCGWIKKAGQMRRTQIGNYPYWWWSRRPQQKEV